MTRVPVAAFIGKSTGEWQSSYRRLQNLEDRREW
jgi:hypothetical protein